MTASLAPRCADPGRSPRALRVAFVLWHGGVGGAERFTNALAAALRDAGVGASVVYVGSPRPTCEELQELGVPFSSFGAGRGRDIAWRPRAFASLLGDVDVAVVQTAGFLPGIIRLGGYRGRLVAVHHGALADKRPALVRRTDELLTAWTLDAHVAVSDYTRSELRRRTGARRVGRIYGGIDTERFAPIPRPAGDIVVGFAGRLYRGKGIHDLLAALSRTNRDLRLVVAGDGPDRHLLERLASDLGMADRVHFLGQIDDMPSFWRSCDIAVVPSVEPEGAGMVALEAAACGKPVVATTAGGLGEMVVDGVTGRLVSPGDIAALAAAVDGYAGDERLRLRHGAAGRRRCETEFALERCAQDYLQLFESLVGAFER